MNIPALIALLAAFDAAPRTDVVLKADPPRETPMDIATLPLMAVSVTLECTARADGRVENCQVLGETHPGLGFAEAAVALMREAEVEPGDKDYQFARTIQFTP